MTEVELEAAAVETAVQAAETVVEQFAEQHQLLQGRHHQLN